jgi:glutathionyl-hydroquinone reductase
MADYPNLSNYMRDLYRVPGVAATVKPRQYIAGYWSIERLNPTRIIPKGTAVDYEAPHDRARSPLKGKFTGSEPRLWRHYARS